MEMPEVKECKMQDCAYNMDMACHALAITVGAETHPVCDTFVRASEKGGAEDSRGRVGACKVSTCKWNSKLECSAPGIAVDLHQQDDADCMTFQVQ